MTHLLAYPYCETCQMSVGLESPIGRAEDGAMQHAGVTGHPVQIVAVATDTVLYTVAGEVGLPLWGPSEGE